MLTATSGYSVGCYADFVFVKKIGISVLAKNIGVFKLGPKKLNLEWRLNGRYGCFVECRIKYSDFKSNHIVWGRKIILHGKNRLDPSATISAGCCLNLRCARSKVRSVIYKDPCLAYLFNIYYLYIFAAM